MIVGFEHWLKSEGLVGVAASKTACAPLLELVRLDRGQNHRCDLFNESVLAYVEDNPDISNVIMIGRWALAASGKRAPGETGRTAILGLSPDNDTTLPNPGNAAAFAFGLQITIDRLLSLGKKITIVEGIPEIGYDVPKAMVRREFIGSAQQVPPSRSDYDERNRLSLSIMMSVLRGRPVRIISVADILCRPDCIVQLGNRSLYRDDDHLSAFGAIWLFPKLVF